DLRPFDLNLALREIYEQFESVAEDRHIRFELNLTPVLPLVHASENEIHRALINLIENALHYTPEHGTVSAKTFTDAEFAVVEVTDTGIGISENDLLHVFEHF